MAWTYLVVDDNDSERAATASLLLRITPSAEVLQATSGEAALVLLEERRVVPSIILLNYDLPGMNGISFLGELQLRRWLERAPVAMVSSPINDRVLLSCYKLGAIGYLEKPASAYELRELVRDYSRPAVRMASATVIPGGLATPRRSAA